MKNRLILFSSAFLLVSLCYSQTNKSYVLSNEVWMKAINTKNVEMLEGLYTENAMVFSPNGVELSNRHEIIDLVKKSDFVVKEVNTTQRINAHKYYEYEIGNFKNKSGGIMKHLIIWRITDSIEVRELEFLAEATDDSIDLVEIKKQRDQWMALCNAHDAKALIENVYTKNTMYYNRGRLLEGREALIPEYGYMNNPKYQLTLEPILVEPVSKTIVYEFGQCKGSYNGKYILVWQKNDAGVWQILFDSNI